MIPALFRRFRSPQPDVRNPVDDGLYRNVWRHAAGARLALAGSMLLLVASQVVKLCVPWCAAKAVDALQAGGPGMFLHALLWVLGVLGAYVGSWLLHGPGRVLERTVGMRVRKSLAETLYGRLAAAPLSWHENHHSSEMQQRAGQATGALYDFAQNQFVYLHSVVNFIGPLVVMRSPDMYTLPLALRSLQSPVDTEWGALMAGSAIATLPLIVLFVLCSRQLISGLTVGAVK